MKSTAIISLLSLFLFTECKNENHYLEKLDSEDIIVNLNIQNADTSIKQIYFYAQNSYWIDLDTIQNYEGVSFGYAGKGESTFFIKLFLKNDTVSEEFYAEGGYRVNLRVSGRKILYQ